MVNITRYIPLLLCHIIKNPNLLYLRINNFLLTNRLEFLSLYG